MDFNPKKINRDQAFLFQGFSDLIDEALIECHSNDHPLHVFEAWRPAQRQDYLYEQGRSRDGDKITWVKGWSSWHQYGLAVDLVYRNDGQWSWDGDYTKPAIYLKNRGIEWLGHKGDLVHYQMTGGLTIAEAKAIREQWGMMGLWNEVWKREKEKHQHRAV